ncbi:hypothetical protein VNI00_018247 [Paramarasmius palmivorus]|uniref:WD40 repeat-like protein n=1 Tax=Paramarasmius palmivorus TaxID=297713 RepID=A0AAW0AYR4_9AGAR
MARHSWRYSLVSTFPLKDSANALRFSPDGRYLACCSQDGAVYVFSTIRQKLVRLYERDSEDSHAIAVEWEDTANLFVGMADGRVIQYHSPTKRLWLTNLFSGTNRRDLATLNGAVLTLHWDKASRRLAVGHGSDVTLLRPYTKVDWNITCEVPRATLPYKPLNFDPKPPCPVGIHTCRFKDRIIVVDRTRGIFAWDVSQAKANMEWRTSPGHKAGMSAISPDCTHIAAWNLEDGVDIYAISRPESRGLKCTIPMLENFGPDAQAHVMLDVLFIHDGEDLLVGSSVGKPTILDFKTHRITQILEHSPVNHSTPIVAYTTYKGNRYIATASRELGEECKVKLWLARSPTDWRFGDVISRFFNIARPLLLAIIILLSGIVIDRLFLRRDNGWEKNDPFVRYIVQVSRRVAVLLLEWGQSIDAVSISASGINATSSTLTSEIVGVTGSLEPSLTSTTMSGNTTPLSWWQSMLQVDSDD